MKLIILGAGGHGRVVADIARQLGRYDSVRFLDDGSEDSDVIGKCGEYRDFAGDDVEMYPAFGNNEARVAWEERIENAGIRLARIVHPMAYVSPEAEVADGSVVMANAVVNTGTVVRRACIVNAGAIVDHDCVLEEGCHVAPGAIVKGGNRLAAGTKVDSGEVVARGSAM